MASPSTNASSLLLADADSYWAKSQRPLQSLLFLLPLILLYEVGIRFYGTDEIRGAAQDILARSWLLKFFDWFGIYGYYLPSLIVVVVLFCWHLFQKDPWKVQPALCGWMWIESLALAVPLFVFALVLFRSPYFEPHLSVIDNGTFSLTPQDLRELVFSIGAGIYEELLFRLIAIALLHLLLVDVLGLSENFGAVASIAVSSILFALYHFWGAIYHLSGQEFDPGKCLFYAAAGAYFAAIYVMRGFGIVAGTHALYDILVVLL